jgi:hypothetical protein
LSCEQDALTEEPGGVEEVKVVFFSTLPSMNGDAPVLADPGLDCDSITTYTLDYLNRPYEKGGPGDYKKRTPPIWKIANLYNRNVSESTRPPAATTPYPNLVKRLTSPDVDQGHAAYKAQLAEYEEQLLDFQQAEALYGPAHDDRIGCRNEPSLA